MRNFWNKFRAFARRADKGQSAIVRHDPLATLIPPLERVLGSEINNASTIYDDRVDEILRDPQAYIDKVRREAPRPPRPRRREKK